MLYITVDEDNKLKYQCKNCNFTSQIEEKDGKSLKILNQNYNVENNESIIKSNKTEEDNNLDKNDDLDLEECDECVMNINYTDDKHNYQQFMNTNIKYDKTLPHVNNIKCPDTNCKKTTDTIYIKYDLNNMKYLYFCCNCEKFWKN
jgi:hypothetical protein